MDWKVKTIYRRHENLINGRYYFDTFLDARGFWIDGSREEFVKFVGYIKEQ